MSFFSKKIKMTVENWCDSFYESYLINDNSETFSKFAYDRIVLKDSEFSSVDISEFGNQLLALYFEITGIAWCIKVNEDSSPKQSEYTRLYLDDHEYKWVWDEMEFYNTAVAEAMTINCDPNTRIGRTSIMLANITRADSFDKWYKKGFDPIDVARAANRVGTSGAWKSHLTHTQLSFVFTDKLNYSPNDLARLELISIIQSFFDIASNDLDKVKIIA